MAKRRPSGDGMVRKAGGRPLGGPHRGGPQAKRRAHLPVCPGQNPEGTAGQAPPGPGGLSGRGAHRGQPHDSGGVAGPVDGGLRRGHPAAQHPAELRAVHPVLHQALSGGQDRLPGDPHGHSKAVPKAETRGPGPRTPGIRARAVGHHGAPHPRHAPPVPEGRGGGPCDRPEPYRRGRGAQGQPSSQTDPHEGADGHLPGGGGPQRDLAGLLLHGADHRSPPGRDLRPYVAGLRREGRDAENSSVGECPQGRGAGDRRDEDQSGTADHPPAAQHRPAAAGAEETRRQPVDLPGTSGSGEAGAPQRRLLLDETHSKETQVCLRSDFTI